jgi:hypothetical protein
VPGGLPRLRMSGDIPPVVLYIFMTWIGTTSHSVIYCTYTQCLSVRHAIHLGTERNNAS